MAAYNLTPIFDNIILQKRLELNMFSFYLDKISSLSNSRFIIGGIDFSLFNGKMNWHQVQNDYFWEILADNILVSGKDIGICQNKCKLIVDTGTSLLTGPSEFIHTLLS